MLWRGKRCLPGTGGRKAIRRQNRQWGKCLRGKAGGQEVSAGLPGALHPGLSPVYFREELLSPVSWPECSFAQKIGGPLLPLFSFQQTLSTHAPSLSPVNLPLDKKHVIEKSKINTPFLSEKQTSFLLFIL